MTGLSADVGRQVTLTGPGLAPRTVRFVARTIDAALHGDHELVQRILITKILAWPGARVDQAKSGLDKPEIGRHAFGQEWQRGPVDNGLDIRWGQIGRPI